MTNEPRRFLWCALPLAGVACAPSYVSPCSPRPGFDQEVRARPTHEHADEDPGVVHVRSPETRAELLNVLRAVTEAYREAPVDRPLTIQVDIPLVYFEGLTCAQIFTAFNFADFCSSEPRA